MAAGAEAASAPAAAVASAASNTLAPSFKTAGRAFMTTGLKWLLFMKHMLCGQGCAAMSGVCHRVSPRFTALHQFLCSVRCLN